MDVLPLMVANAGNSGRAAISSLNSPPIVAVELCREHLVGLVKSLDIFLSCNYTFLPSEESVIVDGWIT